MNFEVSNIKRKKKSTVSKPTKKKKTEEKVEEEDLSLLSPSYAYPYRGRMVWIALVREGKGKGKSIMFKSPAMMGEGSVDEQKFVAAQVAGKKALTLLPKVKAKEIVLYQAGGFGKVYDEQDRNSDLP